MCVCVCVCVFLLFLACFFYGPTWSDSNIDWRKKWCILKVERRCRWMQICYLVTRVWNVNYKSLQLMHKSDVVSEILWIYKTDRKWWQLQILDVNQRDEQLLRFDFWYFSSIARRYCTAQYVSRQVVCPSHSWSMTKRLKTSANFFNHLLVPLALVNEPNQCCHMQNKLKVLGKQCKIDIWI